jgi:heme-degrading monooxygenase HmoA
MYKEQRSLFMHRANLPYTMAVWTVKPGNEQQFILEWQSFADWTAANQPGALKGYLLQDPQIPYQFVSFGPWESVHALRSWRESPQYAEFLARVMKLCSDFLPQLLTQVAATARPPSKKIA